MTCKRIYLCLLLALVGICKTWAQEVDGQGRLDESVVANQQADQRVQSVAVGSVNLLDTYLSQEKYSGVKSGTSRKAFTVGSVIRDGSPSKPACWLFRTPRPEPTIAISSVVSSPMPSPCAMNGRSASNGDSKLEVKRRQAWGFSIVRATRTTLHKRVST